MELYLFMGSFIHCIYKFCNQLNYWQYDMSFCYIDQLVNNWSLQWVLLIFFFIKRRKEIQMENNKKPMGLVGSQVTFYPEYNKNNRPNPGRDLKVVKLIKLKRQTLIKATCTNILILCAAQQQRLLWYKRAY